MTANALTGTRCPQITQNLTPVCTSAHGAFRGNISDASVGMFSKNIWIQIWRLLDSMKMYTNAHLGGTKVEASGYFQMLILFSESLLGISQWISTPDPLIGGPFP